VVRRGPDAAEEAAAAGAATHCRAGPDAAAEVAEAAVAAEEVAAEAVTLVVPHNAMAAEQRVEVVATAEPWRQQEEELVAVRDAAEEEGAVELDNDGREKTMDCIVIVVRCSNVMMPSFLPSATP
jgi:hypothetical protein